MGLWAYRIAAGVAALLALAAALTREWWLAAAAAGVGASVALFARSPERDARVVPPPTEVVSRAELPTSAEPQDVVGALLKASAHGTHAVAAHLWLQDSATASLRQVSSSGERAPASTPLSFDEPFVAPVVQRGEPALEALVALTSEGSSRTLWRFAFPVVGSVAAGAACIDVESSVAPQRQPLESVALEFQPHLAAALALHVARAEVLSAGRLMDAAHALSRRLAPDEVVSHALEAAMALSSAATGSVMLVGEDGLLRISASRGLPDDVVADTAVRSGEGIAGWVLASGKPLLVEDMPHGSGSRRRGVRSSACVPIADEDGVLGVLSVGSQEFPARFTDDHLGALETLGRHVAVALRNARAMESASDLYFATLTALAVALETKDPYARGAAGRIAELVRAMGAQLSLAPAEAHALNVAALLHDIGMGIAGAGGVGAGARPLTTVERGILKAHPVVAAEILADVPALREVVPIVYHHHEWYDGHGYVGGLAGESIPVGARVLAVADAFVAMTSERPYRRALSLASALAELHDKSGSQFDPACVEALERALQADPALALTVEV